MAEAFSIERIDDALRGTLFQGKLHHFASVDSTNARALEDARAGAAAGQVYIADGQTAGRGRGGHLWHSAPERGLYLTALVAPAFHGKEVLKLSMLAALAAKRAIQAVTGVRIDLRWPNDLVLGRTPARKLGGILTEAVSSATGRLLYAAVGIGINLNQTDFPDELAATATSLSRETGFAVSREAIAIALLQEIDTELRPADLDGSGIPERESVFQRFSRESDWVTGRQVRVEEDGGYTGVTAGLTESGLLRVRCNGGQQRIVRHGGVREV